MLSSQPVVRAVLGAVAIATLATLGHCMLQKASRISSAPIALSVPDSEQSAVHGNRLDELSAVVVEIEQTTHSNTRDYEHTFNVLNTTHHEIPVLSKQKSCACTSVELEPSDRIPENGGKIRMRIDMPPGIRQKSASCMLVCSEKRRILLKLTIERVYPIQFQNVSYEWDTTTGSIHGRGTLRLATRSDEVVAAPSVKFSGGLGKCIVNSPDRHVKQGSVVFHDFPLSFEVVVEEHIHRGLCELIRETSVPEIYTASHTISWRKPNLVEFDPPVLLFRSGSTHQAIRIVHTAIDHHHVQLRVDCPGFDIQDLHQTSSETRATITSEITTPGTYNGNLIVEDDHHVVGQIPVIAIVSHVGHDQKSVALTNQGDSS